MKGGNLKIFDQKNKFFSKIEQYSYTNGAYTFYYTPHAFKHLDSWMPVGHPFWDICDDIFFGEHDSEQVIAEQVAKAAGFTEYINEMLDEFLVGMPANYLDDLTIHGRLLETGQYSFRRNDIEVYLNQVHGRLMLYHIVQSKRDVAGHNRAVYYFPKPNVSSLDWIKGTYTVWDDINPTSAIAKTAYNEVNALNPGVPMRGFDICQAVYIRARTLLEADNLAKKKAAEASVKSEKKQQRELSKTVADSLASLPVSHLAPKLTRAELNTFEELIYKNVDDDELSIRQALLDKVLTFILHYGIYHKKQLPLLQSMHEKGSHSKSKNVNDIIELLRTKITELSAARALPAEEEEAETALLQTEETPSKAEGQRRKTKRSKPKRRTKRRILKPRKSTLRARRRTRIV